MLTLQQLRAEPHISISAARQFLACPRSYALSRIEHVEPAFRPVAFAVGSALHAAVGFWLLEQRAGREPRRADALNVVAEALNAEFKSVGPPLLLEDEETEGDLQAQVASMLLAVLDRLPVPERVLGVEVPFRMKLVDESGRRLGAPLIGAIDAVTEEGGGVVFLELKTARNRWPGAQIDTDLQLTAYWRALQHQGFERPRARLLVVTKAKTPCVQLESPPRGVQHERDLTAIVGGVLKAINAGVDFPLRSAWGCKTCPVARACR